MLIQQSFQDLDAEGLYAEYPTGSDFQPLQALQVTSFTPSYDKDRFENTSWTLNGKVGPLRAIYTGGYLDRHISQQMEYTNYSRTGGGIYYQCSGGGAGSSLLGAGQGTAHHLLFPARLLAGHGEEHPLHPGSPHQHAGRLAHPRHRRRLLRRLQDLRRPELQL